MKRLARLGAQAVLPGLVLFLAWLATGALVGDKSGGGSSMPERPETVYAVTAEDVSVRQNRATLRAFGEVIAAESAELRVASPGEVIDVAPDLAVGERVEKGTPLVTIDPFEYEGALRDAKAQLAEAVARLSEADARIAMEESALASLEEQLAIAERDLARAQELVRSGNITDKGVDDRRLIVSQRGQQADARRFTLQAERARREQMAASVDRLEWAVERAERALEDTVLTAPFDGIVRKENAAVGRLLAANDIAVSLIRADALDVRFVLSDERYGRLLAGGSLIGAPVAVTWRIGDVPLQYSATIRRVAADIERETGGVAVFARLDMPDDGVVPRPGAFVEVAVPGRPHERSVRLPATALHEDHVFVIAADDRLERRAVRVLVTDGEEIIVRGPLEDDEAVVTTRLAEVGEGIKVRRVDLGPDPRDPLAESAAQSGNPENPARAAEKSTGVTKTAAEPS
jgi:RND family efflux transporter MFP subunit